MLNQLNTYPYDKLYMDPNVPNIRQRLQCDYKYI